MLRLALVSQLVTTELCTIQVRCLSSHRRQKSAWNLGCFHVVEAVSYAGSICFSVPYCSFQTAVTGVLEPEGEKVSRSMISEQKSKALFPGGNSGGHFEQFVVIIPFEKFVPSICFCWKLENYQKTTNCSKDKDKKLDITRNESTTYSKCSLTSPWESLSTSFYRKLHTSKHT